jgi:hypothetical protein
MNGMARKGMEHLCFCYAPQWPSCYLYSIGNIYVRVRFVIQSLSEDPNKKENSKQLCKPVVLGLVTGQ